MAEEGTVEMGDIYAVWDEPEPSLKDQFIPEMKDKNTWGFDNVGGDEWLLWCGAARDVNAMSEDDFNITAGDINVELRWTSIEKGKAA
jgi:hypothetical protein